MIVRRRGAGVPARALNPIVAVLVGRLGIPIPGLWMLRVHGRRSGRLHSVPVAVANAEGTRYLVAPRGETDWARNVRAAGWCELIRGRSVERVVAVPLDGDAREVAVAAYLSRFGWATRRLFELGRRAGPHEVAAAARSRPSFRLERWTPSERRTSR